MKRVCKQCGKEFEITPQEIQFYKKKNLSIPKRCKECREKNKVEKQSAAVKKQTIENAAPVQKKGKKKVLPGLVAAAFLLIWGGISGVEQNSSVDKNDTQKKTVHSAEELEFRSDKLLEEHFEKHGVEMGFDTPEEYEDAAALVVADEDALHKTEKEDGDDVYYLEESNEFVVISTDGYIRTYFEPEDGMEYFERQ